MAKLGHDDEDQDQSTHVEDPGDDTDESQQVQAEDSSVPQVVQEDERLATQEETEEEGDEEEPARRRETAKERRERARLAKERDKAEIDLLRRTVAKQDQRFKEIEQQLVVSRVTDIDERLATANAEYEQFDRIFGAAITAKNGDDARAAQKLRDEAKQRAWQLYNEKQQIIGKQQPQNAAPAEVPYAQQAVRFLQDKPWYNPRAGDEDSLVVEALDKALSKTMDPNDPGYWETLDRKVRERLPHKFESAQDDDGETRTPQRRKGPPTGGTNRSSGSGGSNPREITLPKEMVEAMKEAGQWDDPKVRARVAKRYHDGLRISNG